LYFNDRIAVIPNTGRLRRVAAALFAVSGIGACAQIPAPAAGPLAAAVEPAHPEPQQEAPKRAEPLPAQELSGQILYQLLLGEISGRRGNLPLAVSAYLDLAQKTRDPRIARRATEMAHFARQPVQALQAARLWVEIDPQSVQARHAVVGLLAAENRFDELAEHATILLAGDAKRLPRTLLQLNRLFEQARDRSAARDLVDRLTQPYLALPEAHFARAQAAHAAGDMAGSYAAASEALRLRPDWEQAALLRAQSKLQSAPEEAVASLAAFLQDHPKAREARLAYARLLTGQKRYPQAREQFQSLLAEFPDNPEVLFAVGVLSFQMEDYATAEREFRRLTELRCAQQDAVRVYLGQIAENRKRYDEALSWYGAVGAGEQYLPAHIRYADVLARQGRLEEGREHLRGLAVKTNLERIQLTLAEAGLLRTAGKLREAFDLLDAALLTHPNQPDLLYEAALLAERIGRMDVLEANLRAVIRIKPDHAHAYNALGYSFADRNERLPEAHGLIAKALALAPNDPFILDSMGWVLYRMGNAAGAIENLERAWKLRSDPEIAAHLGEVLWKSGRRDEATRTWRDAERAHPGNEVLTGVIKRFLP